MSTVSEILNEFCDRINQPRESSYVGGTTPGARQLVSLFKFIGDQLLDYQDGWDQLKRIYPFKTYQGISNYQLPGDFLRCLTGTQWGVTNQIPLAGPLSNARLAFQTYGVNIATPYAGYQINGAQGYKITTTPYTQYSAGYFQISPPGQDSVTENVIQYVSKNYVWAQNWAANTAYTQGNIRTIHDEMWICTVSGTSANTGQYPVYGWDNNVYWQPILVYVASELYSTGQLVYSNSKVYTVTTGGKSSASSPSVSSGSETLGTVTFAYTATPTSWAAGTTYAAGDYVKTASIAYLCMQGGVSGLYQPNFFITRASSVETPQLILKWCVDGTAQWALYREPYPVTADTDFVILDDELFVEGMRWAWYLSKQQFDAAAQYQKLWEGSVRTALGRQNGATVVSAAYDMQSTFDWPVVPVGAWAGTGGS